MHSRAQSVRSLRNLENIVPKATFEPYVLWRLAPSKLLLPETLARGHLNEVNLGLHWNGTLPANLDYDSEFDWQTGSLGSSTIKMHGQAYAGVWENVSKAAAKPRVLIEGTTPPERRKSGGTSVEYV